MTTSEQLRFFAGQNQATISALMRHAADRIDQLESDLDKTAADVLAVIEGRDPETWAWPLHGLRDALEAARKGARP